MQHEKYVNAYSFYRRLNASSDFYIFLHKDF